MWTGYVRMNEKGKQENTQQSILHLWIPWQIQFWPKPWNDPSVIRKLLPVGFRLEWISEADCFQNKFDIRNKMTSHRRRAWVSIKDQSSKSPPNQFPTSLQPVSILFLLNYVFFVFVVYSVCFVILFKFCFVCV